MDFPGVCALPDAPVLIADDDPFMLDLLEHKLRLAGFEVRRAGNGVEAIAAARAGVRAAVLDAMMPVMDGFQTLQALKQNPDTAKVPVIMLTALKQDEHVLRALKLGAADYLAKPFNPNELVARLERLIPTAA
jgi:DNA-binding response OmpR family regulator